MLNVNVSVIEDAPHLAEHFPKPHFPKLHCTVSVNVQHFIVYFIVFIVTFGHYEVKNFTLTV